MVFTKTAILTCTQNKLYAWKRKAIRQGGPLPGRRIVWNHFSFSVVPGYLYMEQHLAQMHGRRWHQVWHPKKLDWHNKVIMTPVSVSFWHTQHNNQILWGFTEGLRIGFQKGTFHAFSGVSQRCCLYLRVELQEDHIVFYRLLRDSKQMKAHISPFGVISKREGLVA